jgi:hypothetical protein
MVIWQGWWAKMGHEGWDRLLNMTDLADLTKPRMVFVDYFFDTSDNYIA